MEYGGARAVDSGGTPGERPCMRLNNEFALVKLEADYSANGVRLKITSTRTGRVAYLDPLQLEVLTWLPTAEYLRYMETPFGPEEADLRAVPEAHERIHEVPEAEPKIR